jgi:hypothetical protein
MLGIIVALHLVLTFGKLTTWEILGKLAGYLDEIRNKRNALPPAAAAVVTRTLPRIVSGYLQVHTA